MNPIAPRPKRQQPPLVEPETRQRTAADDAYNARRLEQRRVDNRAALTGLYDLVNTLAIPDRAVLLFAYLYHLADECGLLQVRPTNAHISEATGLCERRIQRAFRDLEAAQIGKIERNRQIDQRARQSAQIGKSRHDFGRLRQARGRLVKHLRIAVQFRQGKQRHAHWLGHTYAVRGTDGVVTTSFHPTAPQDLS